MKPIHECALSYFPEHEELFTGEDDPGTLRDDREELARERRWSFFEADCREFAKAEGWPAVLRAVSRAMSQ